MRSLVFAVLCLLALPASADLVQVSWTNPTTWQSGAALPASDISKTRVEYGTNTSATGCTFGVKAGEVSTVGSATNVTTPDLAVGNYAFRAYTTAKGLESAASSSACKAIVQSPPGSPTGLTVTVTINITSP